MRWVVRKYLWYYFQSQDVTNCSFPLLKMLILIYLYVLFYLLFFQFGSRQFWQARTRLHFMLEKVHYIFWRLVLVCWKQLVFVPALVIFIKIYFLLWLHFSRRCLIRQKLVSSVVWILLCVRNCWYSSRMSMVMMVARTQRLRCTLFLTLTSTVWASLALVAECCSIIIW